MNAARQQVIQIDNWPSDIIDYRPLYSRKIFWSSVSAIIGSVAPVAASDAISPLAGSVTSTTDGDKVAVTDPSTDGKTPVTIKTTSGTTKVSAGTAKSNVIVKADDSAAAKNAFASSSRVEIGNAVDTDGNILDASGSTYQVDDNYLGDSIVNLTNAQTSGEKVDISTITTDGSTIASNLPGASNLESDAFAKATDLDYYVNTGKGDDQIAGSSGNDFIRSGAGDDKINAAGGDDIVRSGTGDDLVKLGSGDDTLYYTVDQLQTASDTTATKTITDFDSAGNDVIKIDSALKDLVDIEGVGSKAIKITLSGAQTGVTEIVSKGESIDDDDIEFV